VNDWVKAEYRRLRAKEWPARDALRAAKVKDAWEDAEAEGLVRAICEPEIDYYDDSYVDTWEISDARKARIKADIAARIERDGHWMYATEYLDPVDGWTVADSCGGFVGEDFEDSGYDTDMREAALKALAAIDPKLCEGWC